MFQSVACGGVLTTHVDRLDAVTFGVHFVQDMTGLQRNRLGVGFHQIRFSSSAQDSPPG